MQLLYVYHASRYLPKAHLSNLMFFLLTSQVDLLQKKCIRTEDTNEVLIRVIEGPVTRHLPVHSRVVGKFYTPF